MSERLILIFFTTAVLGFGVSAAVRPLLRPLGLVDVPNHRSSHTEITPRGGGIAVVLTIAVAFAASIFLGEIPAVPELVVVAAAILLAVTGLVDDIRNLRVTGRLAVQIVVSCVLAAALLHFGAQSLWLVLMVAPVGVAIINGVNFMDGVNGISSMHGMLLGATMAWVGLWSEMPALAILGTVVVSSFLGFLPWNFPKAKMFLGDVGSYFLGGLFLGGGMLIWMAAGSLLLAIAPVSIYMVDVFETLVRRARNGAALTEAHSDHNYQSIGRASGSHVIATLYALLASMMVVSVSFADLYGLLSLPLSLVLVVGIGLTYLMLGRALGVPAGTPRNLESTCV